MKAFANIVRKSSILRVVLLSWALLATEAGHAADPQVPFVVGVGTHFANGVGVLPVNLSMIQQANVGAIRDGLEQPPSAHVHK